MANWVDHSHDILTEIARRIKLHEDFVAFRGVCTSWQSAALIDNFTNRGNQIPWLMLPPKINSKNRKIKEFFSISKATARQVMLPQFQRLKCFSSKGWLLTISPSLNIALLHPFSGRSIKLPHMCTFKDWNGTLRVKNMQRDFICKFFLSSTLDPNYTVIVIHGNKEKLAYFRPGNKVWNTIETGSSSCLDVILYREQFYAINSLGKIMVCDISGDNPIVANQVAQMPWELYYGEDLEDETQNGLMHAYLVESAGALWVVTREFDDEGTDLFLVFEVDLSTNVWKEIDDLGNRALFLGYNSSLSIEASETSYCKPNSIYFTPDCCKVPSNKGGRVGNDMGVYNFEDKSIAPFYTGHNISSRLTPPMWVEQSYK